MHGSPLAAAASARRRAAAGGQLHATGQQNHGRDGFTLHMFGQTSHHVGQRAVVLFGEHLRRRHQHGLSAGTDRLQHGCERHHRFAGADLTLQETLHRAVLFHIGGDDVDDLALAVGQVERQ